MLCIGLEEEEDERQIHKNHEKMFNTAQKKQKVLSTKYKNVKEMSERESYDR
jgi:hypothetical protein